MLVVDKLRVKYGHVRALHGISLNVQRGEIVTLVGPNGAGKSSTLRAIAGGVQPSDGSIELDGSSLVGLAPETIARRGISLVPEGRHVFARLTVEENLRIGTDLQHDKETVEAGLSRILKTFPVLSERLGTPAGKLSGGEQQQLAISRAVMTGAKLILIDEPSLGLAPMVIDAVYETIHALRAMGNTFFIVEQSTHRALENADRIYVLRGGEIQLHGSANELDDQQIELAYFGFDNRRRAGTMF